jgi:hypothetical protein
MRSFKYSKALISLCDGQGAGIRGQVHFHDGPCRENGVRLHSSLYNRDLGRSGQIMELLILVRIQTIIGFTCALIVLYFQVRAYRRHRKTFFAILAASTGVALLASAAASAPYFVPLSQERALDLYRLAVPGAVLAAFLATWGSICFFLAYDKHGGAA